MPTDAHHAASSLHVLRVPPRAPSDAVRARAPALVLLHGVGSNEEDLPALARTFDSRFALFSVRAPITLGARSFAWFHVSFTADGPVHDVAEAEAARVQLIAYLKTLRADPAVDPQAITLVGFSQGAILALSIALTEPELVQHVVAISGRTLQEIQARVKGKTLEGAPRVLLLHGTQDAKLPFSHAATSDAVLTAAGVPHEFRSYEAGHTVTAEMRDDIAAWLEATLPAR